MAFGVCAVVQKTVDSLCFRSLGPTVLAGDDSIVS